MLIYLEHCTFFCFLLEFIKIRQINCVIVFVLFIL